MYRCSFVLVMLSMPRAGQCSWRALICPSWFFPCLRWVWFFGSVAHCRVVAVRSAPRVAWGSFYLSCLCFCVCGPPALVSWRAAVWSLSLRWGDALVCRRPCLGLVLAAVLLFYVLHLLVTLY